MNPSQRSGGPAPAESTPRVEPVQRWRVVFRRRADAPPLAQREQLQAWETALAESGLPLAMGSSAAPRPRIVTAAPLPVAMAAERELLDVFLVQRRPVAEVRSALAAVMPAGHELIDAHDVWLGEPPLSGQVAMAVYRVVLSNDVGAGPAPAALRDAVERLLARPGIRRSRSKGDRTVEYDLRPLLAAIDVIGADPDPNVVASLRIHTRFDPERGVGRPEEVVAALAEELGAPITPGAVVRERLLLRGEA